MNLSKKEASRETSNPMLFELKVNTCNVPNNNSKTKITELNKMIQLHTVESFHSLIINYNAILFILSFSFSTAVVDMDHTF